MNRELLRVIADKFANAVRARFSFEKTGVYPSTIRWSDVAEAISYPEAMSYSIHVIDDSGARGVASFLLTQDSENQVSLSCGSGVRPLITVDGDNIDMSGIGDHAYDVAIRTIAVTLQRK